MPSHDVKELLFRNTHGKFSIDFENFKEGNNIDMTKLN